MISFKGTSVLNQGEAEGLQVPERQLAQFSKDTVSAVSFGCFIISEAQCFWKLGWVADNSEIALRNDDQIRKRLVKCLYASGIFI